MLEFNSLLDLADIDPAGVMLIRHAPKEPALRPIFPWLVGERPDLFMAWQQVQWKTAEKAMMRASHVAAFVGIEPSVAVFAGLSRINGSTPIDHQGYLALPGNAELIELGMSPREPGGPDCLAFDLEPLPVYDDYVGKLVIGWPKPDQSWWRWSKNGVFPVRNILEENRFERGMPGWDELILSWDELRTMPRRWQDTLANWRGVYYIYDGARSAGYVGSACGADNILGRWRAYSETGHGGNKQLRLSNPRDLRFSILQRTSPDMLPADVVALEGTWKMRLHSRVHGLNEN